MLEKTDTLVFSPNELELEAVVDNLPEVQSFVEERLEAADCPMKAQMQISVAVEEIFVNIANYAYKPEKGKAIVRVEVTEKPVAVAITFVDHGVPYDPLAKVDPDVTLAAHEREIGGLGIFMTKKIMDDVAYEYRDGQNILTLKKNL
ncbi:MAG: ATP-binding protein [Oscillospiraceae bacterium]|nr:ATP-binding protein [Oscillospiraceae bacterium]